MSTLVKKYLMALSGIVLAGFVFFHMAGNLQIFLHPDALNDYAYFLHHTLPASVLWLFRIVLLVAVVVHIWVAILLKKDNRAARPEKYAVKDHKCASNAARYAMVSGLILLSFIIFHLLHFTTRDVFQSFEYILQDTEERGVHQDLYARMVWGFSSHFWYVSAFYVVSMAMLAWHLSHGVSSLFQSLGIRNEKWRYRLDKVALGYSAIVSAGFIVVPLGVLVTEFTPIDVIYDGKTIIEDLNQWNQNSEVFFDYNQ